MIHLSKCDFLRFQKISRLSKNRKWIKSKGKEAVV
jgi:hypothetical protein